MDKYDRAGVKSMVKKIDRGVTSGVKTKERQPMVAMVPLFSLPSIIRLAIGFIVGAMLAFGYWVVSPALASSGTEAESGGVAEFIGLTSPNGPWASKVNIQIVNPGSSYRSLGELGGRADYYAAKANSLPFLEFLSQGLAKQAPEYSYTIDELDQMVTIRSDRSSEPPVVKISVTASNIEETLFLVSLIPEVFQKYLNAEENKMQQGERQRILSEIENVKMALLETEKEISTLNPQGADKDVNNDPTYIALNAKIEALEVELNRQAAELAVTEENNMQPQEYEKTLQEMEVVTSAALSEAKEELYTLMQERADNDIRNHPDYIALNARIVSLDLELDRRMTELAVLVAEGAAGNDYSYSYSYTNTISAVERTSTALAEARKELAVLEAQIDFDNLAQDLEYQLAEGKVVNLSKELSTLGLKLTSSSTWGQGFRDDQAAFERTSTALAKARREVASLKGQAGFGLSAEDLDYQIAKTKVGNLNKELAGLNVRLSSSLAKTVDESATIDYLAVENPSMPLPVLPERMRMRNALLMGAILGTGLAWAVLNFRWLAKGMPLPPAPVPEEDEEDEV